MNKTAKTSTEIAVPDVAPTETVEAEASSTTYEKGKLYQLNLNSLNEDPNQPRKFFDSDEMEELVASVKRHGVLQPIIFRRETDGILVIVAGERRFLASKQAGRDTIPAIFTTGNHTEIALVENLLRSDLTPLEVAEAVQNLKNEEGYQSKDLCAIIGKAESTISEILSLNKLPDTVKDKVRREKKYSRAQLLTVVTKGKDEKTMLKQFESLEKSLDRSTKPSKTSSTKSTESPSTKLTENPSTNPTKSPADILKGKIERFKEVIESFNFDDLEDTARTELKEILIKLVALIEKKTARA